jgi:hypothetical protein
MQTLSAGAIERATHAFYRSILRGADVNAATRAIGAVLEPNEAVFITVTAEWLFMEILKGYYNEWTTDEQIAARVDRAIASLPLAGAPPADMPRLRG